MMPLLPVLAILIAVAAPGPALAQPAAGERAAASGVVQDLLAQQLSVDAAVRIALTNNRDMEARSDESVATIRAAWFRAVAARQGAAYLDEMRETVDLAVEFAQGLRAAGNWSALDLMRSQVLRAELAADLAQGQATATLEQERLAHLMGVAPRDMKLPARLADVPRERAPAPEPANASDEARWATRAAYVAYGAAHQRAWTYQTVVLPLRRAIAEEMVLRFNGMLIDVFALLADARERSAAMLAATEAQRDFWLAENALRFAAATHADADEPPRLGLGLPSAGADRH